jgi:high affinity sulfate transporter 1
MLATYRKGYLRDDLAAGLVLTAVLVPVGMGYAQAAGLPAIQGLYATIVPLLAYAVFGPSRILVLGPDSSLAGIIAAIVAPLAALVPHDPGRAMALAATLSVLAGLLCIVGGLLRVGFLTDLLSKPIRMGYLNGIALSVLVGQAPKLLGVPGGGDDLFEQVGRVAGAVLDGGTNPVALAIGLSSLALILACRRWSPRVPGILVAVVGATIAVGALGLDGAVKTVGALPEGLPVPSLPAVSWDDVRALLPGALALAVVSFADMSVLSRTYALRRGHEVDGNQELVALGAANVATGFFQGFAVSSSSSRTPVAESAGARTQMTGVIGALCCAGLLVFAPNLLATLPIATLGAVVIAACTSLVDVSGVWRLWSLRRMEFALALVSFLGVALVGVIEGIFLAVILALAGFVWRAWRPYDAVLGRVDGLKGYHDITRYPHAKRVPGLVLYRWDAPLFFANAALFRKNVLHAIACAPTRVRWVVVAAEPVTDVDLTAADVLLELDADLTRLGVELCFAEMKDPVKDHLKRYGTFHALGPENFFPTLGQAVDSYVRRHDVAWVDWSAVAAAPPRGGA